jgi:ketosteroid isomerase-like protein
MAKTKVAAKTGGLTEEFVRAFADRYHGAWNRHDALAIAELVTEDIVFEDPFIFPTGVCRGRAGLRAVAERWWSAMPDLTFTTEDLYVSLDGIRAAHAWTGRGTLRGELDPPGFAPTNTALDMYGVSRWEFRDGLLAHLRENTDVYAVARQAGALPEPNTRKERLGVWVQRLEARRLRRRARR